MASSEEIRQRLKNKREGNLGNGYLVCNSCGGYYELQSGESWKDFNTECECGGQLVQSATDSLFPSEEEYEYKRYDMEIVIAYFLILFGAIPAAIMGIYLITRSNKRAKLHGKIVLLISLGFFFIVFSISALLIYRAYFSQPDISQFQDLSSVRSMRLFVTCFLNLTV